MSLPFASTSASAPARPAASLSLTSLVMAWAARRRARASLARLDQRLLKDVGLTEFAARAEVEKPFWQA